MPDRAEAEAEATAPDAVRRRRVRRSAILLTLVAAAFYFGFIAMMLVRGSK
jgi:ferric-dicitrate binding protein FerR (iron transport regulator)